MTETINVEKYIEALNNLLGSDNAYYAGDPDVDAIVEVIMTAKKLENRVKELTEENEKLRADCDGWLSLVEFLNKNNAELETELSQTYDLLEKSKADTVWKMQEKLKRSPGINIAGLVHYVIVESDLDQIVKEMLEE